MLDTIKCSDETGEHNLYLFERLFGDCTHEDLKWAKEEYDIGEDATFVFKGIKPDAIHHGFKETVDEEDLDPCFYTLYCRATYSYQFLVARC